MYGLGSVSLNSSPRHHPIKNKLYFTSSSPACLPVSIPGAELVQQGRKITGTTGEMCTKIVVSQSPEYSKRVDNVYWTCITASKEGIKEDGLKNYRDILLLYKMKFWCFFEMLGCFYRNTKVYYILMPGNSAISPEVSITGSLFNQQLVTAVAVIWNILDVTAVQGDVAALQHHLLTLSLIILIRNSNHIGKSAPSPTQPCNSVNAWPRGWLEMG